MPKKPASSRRAENKQRIRRGILTVAAELFAAQGVEDTTADDIAGAARVSRATFFNYFPGKPALIAALVGEMDAGLRADIEAGANAPQASETPPVGVQPPDLVEALCAGFAAVAARVEANAPFFRALIGEVEGCSELGAGGAGRLSGTYEALAAMLAAGASAGAVRGEPPAAVLAEVVGGTLLALLRNWRTVPGYPLAERLERAARLLGDGLRPTQGAGAAGRRRAAAAPRRGAARSPKAGPLTSR